ncbi:MAG: nitrate- and nitrite sensing domain-containing protein [SAR324 cluster bacterium]|nr:nitrate- and nitrite sensing domain-containing protein [SAR324 cluster bacterium]
MSDGTEATKSILALLLIPTLALFYIVIDGSLESRSFLKNMDTLSQFVVFSTHSSHLIHSLQKERGLSAGLLSSRTTHFSSQLSKQRYLSDFYLKELFTFLEHPGNQILSGLFEEEIRALKKETSAIQNIRSKVNNLNIDLKKELDFYTKIIRNFINLIFTSLKYAQNSELSTSLLSYMALMEVQEYAGIERAILANAFAQNLVTSETSQQVETLMAHQNQHISSFLFFADVPHQQVFREISGDRAFYEVRRLREVAFRQIPSENFNQQAEYWFEMATKRIDLLYSLQTKISVQLNEKASQLAQAARDKMLEFLLIAGISLGLTLMTVYMIQRLRQNYLLLEGEITERRQVEKELKKYEEQLGEMVAKRTEALLQAKQEAELANSAKSEFLANITHELRTPLHAILSASQKGVRWIDKDDRERKIRRFSQIKEYGERLLALVSDLLDLSKLEARKTTFQMQKTDLKPLVHTALQIMEELTSNRIIRFSAEGIDTTAWCDDTRLLQVILNLLSNAFKFTTENTKILIVFQNSVLSGNQYNLREVPALSLKVIDEGVGIPEEELQSIFDQFTQSSKTKTKAGGTGLGLAICREIVEAHQGRIWAEQNPAGGSIFTLQLPRENTFQHTN